METQKRGHEKKTGREMSPEVIETPPFPGDAYCYTCCTYCCMHVPTDCCTRYLLQVLLKFYTYCCTYVLKKIPGGTEKYPRGDDNVPSPGVNALHYCCTRYLLPVSYTHLTLPTKA